MANINDRAFLHITPGAEVITSLANAFARLPRQPISKARPSNGRSLPAVGSFS